MRRVPVMITCLSLCLSVSLALSACAQKQDAGTAEEETTIAEAVDEEEEAIAEVAEESGAVVEVADEEMAAVAEESATAEEKNYDNLASWGIKIEVPNGTTSVLKGSDYYIYTEHDGALPYIIISSFTLDTDEQGFLDEFTAYMKGSHSDLVVEEEPTQVKIGDKDCWKIVYAYDIQGYAAKDTRVVTMKDGRQYLFGTKSIDELSISTGDTFEQVIAAADIYGTK